MAILVLLIIAGCAAGIVSFVWVRKLRSRVDELECLRLDGVRLQNLVANLRDRLSKLEETVRATRSFDRVEPSSAMVPVERTAPAEASVPLTADLPVAVPAPISPIVPVPVEAPPLVPQPLTSADAETDAPSSSAWEVVVGANWLNRVGVLAIVIGIAFGVAYTVGRTGPLGRIALGYASSLVLLGMGVWLERRPAYRTYAYGLIGGGWAATYFTTYAMHGIEGARIVESPVLATTALAAVAAGMVAHSLRYRSQAVVGLAYLIAYATLALTPLTGFALAATVPLSASLLLVTLPLGWFHVAVMGIVSTYTLFALRGVVFFDALEPASLIPYFALWSYWVVFEAADIFMQWKSRRAEESKTEPLFALNAIAFAGAAIVLLPDADPMLLSNFLAVTALLYGASAFIRMKWLASIGGSSNSGVAALSGTSQGAIGVAAALLLWAIGLRYSGTRETIAMLFVAELLFAAGITLGDRLLRLFGAVASAIVVFMVLAAVREQTAAAAVIALVFYANREILRARQLTPESVEVGYTWAASVLVVNVIGVHVGVPYVGLALIAVALALTEMGVRRGSEYRYQAYALAAIGLAFVVTRHTGAAIAESDVTAWRVLPAAIVLLYAMAARIASRASTGADAERRYAAGAAMCAGAALVALLEWRVAATLVVAPLWAGTGLALVALGSWRRVQLFTWQGYALVLTAIPRAVQPILTSPAREADGNAILWAGTVILALYVAGVVGRRSLVGRTGPAADGEDPVRLSVLLAASIGLLILIAREVHPSGMTLGLGLAGMLLVGLGLALRERVLRLSGLAIFGIGIARLFVSDLVRLEGLTRILSFVVSGLGLLAVSWVYTRYRPQILKLL